MLSPSISTTTTTIYYNTPKSRNKTHHHQQHHDLISYLKRFGLAFSCVATCSFAFNLSTRADLRTLLFRASATALPRSMSFVTYDYLMENKTDNSFLAGSCAGVLPYLILTPIYMIKLDQIFKISRNIPKLVLERGALTKYFYPSFVFLFPSSVLQWGLYFSFFTSVNSWLNPYHDVDVGGAKELARSFLSAEIARNIATLILSPFTELRQEYSRWKQSGFRVNGNARFNNAEGVKLFVDENKRRGVIRNMEICRDVIKFCYSRGGVRSFFFLYLRNVVNFSVMMTTSLALALYDRAKVTCY